MAEYTGFINAVKHALAADWGETEEFVFEGDSQLVVCQVLGQWDIKADHIKPLCHEARHLFSTLQRQGAVLRWIPREENKRADELATQGRDNLAKRYNEADLGVGKTFHRR